MRCLPLGHSLLEIVEDQLCKQHEFIREGFQIRTRAISGQVIYDMAYIIWATLNWPYDMQLRIQS